VVGGKALEPVQLVAKRWNPFNSFKLLAQVYRWELIRRGEPIPQPALISIDPANACNLDCQWCNSEKILLERDNQLSATAMERIGDFLPQWQGCPEWRKGVEAICIGGGEPLMNAEVGALIRRSTRHGVETGIVSNGLLIHEFLDELLDCTWVGVSVDAASGETYNRLKAGGKNPDLFDRVLANIAALTDRARRGSCRLGVNRSGYGVSYKYLLCRENLGEVYEAARLAKQLGCRNFHLRPGATPWNKLAERKSPFSEEQLALFQEQIERARE
jgi:MoaA/NifB/PqqE/SkfB family radical SAM enzyme